MKKNTDNVVDYIIVGAGSAGCVLAERLSAIDGATVLLLEAGPSDTNPYIAMPAGFYKLTGSKLTWGYETSPQRHAHQRRIPFSQGKVVGGSSSINGMVYTRGHPSDYDRWAFYEGCPGWSYKETLPHFLRSEDNNIFVNSYHGSGGPLAVSDAHFVHPLSRLFVKAAQQMGLPHNPDFNGSQQYGCGLYQTTTRDGRRCSSSTAYLHSAQAKRNLRIITSAMVLRIVTAAGRAIGVDYLSNGGKVHQVRAACEIVVAAGAFGSPKLLLHSGIGSAVHLQPLGIRCVADLPGVGKNLQDHIDVDTVYQLKNIESLDVYRRPTKAFCAGMEYFLFHRGPVTSNIVEAGAFWRSSESLTVPDLQLHFLPGAGVEENTPTVPQGSGCTLNSYFLRPRSRGCVSIESADPRVPPRIDPNYWAEPYDLDRSLDGLMLSREIMHQPIFRQFIASERLPGLKINTRPKLIEFLRSYGRTAYHPVGTCKMGVDSAAVVDTNLRVHGIEGLRVVDASVMPSLIGANTNAATIMIAERGGEMIASGKSSVAPLPRPEGARSDAMVEAPSGSIYSKRLLRSFHD